MHWRRKWQPTPVFLPGESQGWGSLVAAIYGVAQSRTRMNDLAAAAFSTYYLSVTFLKWSVYIYHLSYSSQQHLR